MNLITQVSLSSEFICDQWFSFVRDREIIHTNPFHHEPSWTKIAVDVLPSPTYHTRKNDFWVIVMSVIQILLILWISIIVYYVRRADNYFAPTTFPSETEIREKLGMVLIIKLALETAYRDCILLFTLVGRACDAYRSCAYCEIMGHHMHHLLSRYDWENWEWNEYVKWHTGKHTISCIVHVSLLVRVNIVTLRILKTSS
jgi:hypothetical protein